MPKEIKAERDEETEVVAFAKDKGIKTYKIAGTNDTGKPDRFFGFGGKAVFIEMKKKGEEPTKIQYKELRELKSAGFLAEWFDSSEKAIAYLTSVFNIGKLNPLSVRQAQAFKRIHANYRPADIAAEMGLHRSQVSELLKTLEKKGYIEGNGYSGPSKRWGCTKLGLDTYKELTKGTE